MADIIYTLCAITAFTCAFLLFKAHSSNKYRLLLWGGLCFTGLTLTNILLIVDKIFLPLIDLSVWRQLMTLISILILLYGLIMDIE